MFVWPPTPLQPLDDGPDRKLAHSDRFALAMMIAPAAFSCFAMNASPGGLPASAHDPAVVPLPAAGGAGGECPGAARRRHAGGVDVVLHDDRNPEQRTLVTLPPRLVGRSC